MNHCLHIADGAMDSVITATLKLHIFAAGIDLTRLHISSGFLIEKFVEKKGFPVMEALIAECLTIGGMWFKE